MMLRSAAAFVCSAALFCVLAAGKPSALDKPTLEAYVRRLFGWPASQVKVVFSEPKASKIPGFVEVEMVASAGQASQQETFLITKDGQRVIRGAVYDIAQSPFQADLELLKTEGAPSWGPDNAPVTIVEFSDFQCSFCKDEAKVLRENLAKAFPTQVRLVYKDFPLEQIHPWARTAALAGRCIFQQNPQAFWDYHDWVFEKQPELTVENFKSRVTEFGSSKKIAPQTLAACMAAPATAAALNAGLAEARTLQVNSTPTLYVNGRKLVGKTDWPQLKAIIEEEAGYASKNAAACCEVTLPSPGSAPAKN